MKKLLFYVIVALVVLSVFTACSGKKEAAGASSAAPAGPSGTVTFQYWADEQKEGIDNMVSIFNKANPNIKVEATLIPGREPHYNRLMASLPSGTGPDIMTHNSNIMDYLGYLYPLDDIIPKTSIDVSKFPKSIIDFYTFDGKLYAIPKDFDTIAIFYNKELFKKAGVPFPTANWNWEEFRQTAAKLTKGNVVGFACDWEDAQVGFGNFVRQARGGPVHVPGPGVKVNDSTVVDALEFIRKLMYVDKVAIDGVEISETNASDLFMSERVAMISHGSWKVGPFFGAMGDNLGVTEMPKGQFQACQINGLGFALNKGTKNYDAAVKFLEFIASKEGQAATAKVVIPAYEGAADQWLAAFPTLDLKVFLDSVRFAYTEAPYPKNTRATNAMLVDQVAVIVRDPKVNIKAELDKAQAKMEAEQK